MNDQQAVQKGGLTLTEYARVAAHLRHFPREQRSMVLARLGLTGQQWEDAVSEWTEAMAEEIAREEESLSRCFGEVLAETREQLKAEKPALETIGHDGEIPAESERPVIEMPPPRCPEVPTFLLPSELPAVDALPSSERRPSGLDTTQDLGDAPRSRPAMPFIAVAQVAPKEGLPLDGERSLVSMFGPVPVSSARAPSPSGSCVDLGVGVAKAQGESPLPKPAIGDDHGMAQTLDLSTVPSTARARGTTLPFRRPPEGSSSRNEPRALLSLEQHAALSVALAVAPANREAVLASYGTTDAERLELDAYWKERMNADSAVRAAWQVAFNRHRDLLQNQERRDPR